VKTGDGCDVPRVTGHGACKKGGVKEIITCTSSCGSLSIGDGCVVGEFEVPQWSNSLVRYQSRLANNSVAGVVLK
jgi:hypothetical protein